MRGKWQKNTTFAHTHGLSRSVGSFAVLRARAKATFRMHRARPGAHAFAHTNTLHPANQTYPS